MASKRFLFLLATLAVATAAPDYGNNQPTYPTPTTEPKQGEPAAYPATSPSCGDYCNKDATERLATKTPLSGCIKPGPSAAVR